MNEKICRINRMRSRIQSNKNEKNPSQLPVISKFIKKEITIKLANACTSRAAALKRKLFFSWFIK